MQVVENATDARPERARSSSRDRAIASPTGRGARPAIPAKSPRALAFATDQTSKPASDSTFPVGTRRGRFAFASGGGA